MRIHTVKTGDTIWKIARKYSTPAPKIIEHNTLNDPDMLIPGQKLMIFTPTRTYTVKGGDTLGDIAIRFSTSKNALFADNPALMGCERIYPGQILAVKYDTPIYGSGSANAYLFDGYSEDKLRAVFPYISYLTISSMKWEQGRLFRIFNPASALKLALENGKNAIMRVYSNDSADIFFKNEKAFSEALINTAKKDGYSGVCPVLPAASRNRGAYMKFLLELKRALLMNDLLLFSELDGNGELLKDAEISEIADTVIIDYQKGGMREFQSFDEGERKLLCDFAEHGECQKALFSLPSFAYANDKEIEFEEALKLAKKTGAEILFDEESYMCAFYCKHYRGGRCEEIRIAYESAENIKAKLDLIGELGYMGISFDAMRVPTEYLMLFHTNFHCGRESIVRGRQSCLEI